MMNLYSLACPARWATHALARPLAAVGLLLTTAGTAHAQAPSFSPMAAYPTTGSRGYFVATGDLNGDGTLDLVSANSFSSNVSVLLSRAAGGFSAAVTYAVPDLPQEITLVDINRDGKLDAVLPANGSVVVLLGAGNGTLGKANVYSSGNSLSNFNLKLYDVTRDGILDAVVCSTSNTVSVLPGTASGTFGPATVYSVGSSLRSLNVGDFNHDGRADIVVSDANRNDLYVLLGRDSDFAAPIAYATGRTNFDLTTADLNRDGQLDIIIGGYTTPSVGVLSGNADGTFNAIVSYPVNATSTYLSGITTGDVNGDGYLDVVVNDAFRAKTIVLPGSSTGALGAASTFGAGDFAFGVTLADINRDGKLDLVVANGGDAANTLGVLLNTTTYAVPTLTSLSPTSGPVGTSVTLTGTDLTGATTVNFNGIAATFTVVNATTVTATVPTGASTGNVTVTTPSGTSNGLTFSVALLTTWTGAVGTDWYSAANWTVGVPTDALDAIIPAAVPNFPLISGGTAIVRNLTINAGASLAQEGGTLNTNANLANNGTFAATGGTVVLGNTALANVLGSSSTRFWNLTVNSNGAQLSTTASTSVQRLLTLNSTFATNGNPLTLESNAANTALVVNNGAVTGAVTVQRYIAPDLNPGLGYRHYSSPVSTATVGSLTTASFTPVVNPNYNTSATPNSERPFPTVYSYDQARLTTSASTNNLVPFDKGWTSPSALSDPLVVGRGYTVNLAADQTLAVTGPLNNGVVSQPLAHTTTFSPDAGWALVGNPYPSPLDYSLVPPADRIGLDAALYVYESDSQYGGSYRASVNGVGGNANSPNSLVAQGQGFFVRVSIGQTSATLNLRNSCRVTAYQNPAYYRTAETRPLVQLNLQSATGSDPLYVYFEPGATAGTDVEYDAVKLPNSTGLNLAAWAGTDQLAINALPLRSTAAVTVPLFISLPATGTYTLHAAQVLNFGAGQQPFLRDVQLGTLTDLRLHPDYSFTMNAANTTPRFELVFGAKVLGVASATLAAQVAVYPNPASKEVFVELPAALSRQNVTATLVDGLGRVVLTQVLTTGPLPHPLPLLELAPGVYSLRLQTEAGVVVKKLVLE